MFSHSFIFCNSSFMLVSISSILFGVFILFHNAFKTYNLTSRDLDDEIKASHEHMNDVILATHYYIGECFDSIKLEKLIGMIHTKLDNKQHIQDVRHDSLESLIIDVMN